MSDTPGRNPGYRIRIKETTKEKHETYKKEVIRLVKKLPTNIGVRFHEEQMYGPDTLHIMFRLLRADREYAMSKVTHETYHYPADILVLDVFYALTRQMMEDEETKDSSSA